MESVETQLPSSPTTPQLARRFLRAALQTWELDGFGAVTELLATELVSNVVMHVGKPMTLRVTRDDDSMTVEVDDPSPALPTMQHPGADDEHGRGILLVNELANSWGAHPRVDGKTVWFALDVSTATAEPHEGGESSIQSPSPTISSDRRAPSGGDRSRWSPPVDQPFVCADQHPDVARIEERHLAEIDGHASSQRVERRTQRVPGRTIELAVGGQDRARARAARRDHEGGLSPWPTRGRTGHDGSSMNSSNTGAACTQGSKRLPVPAVVASTARSHASSGQGGSISRDPSINACTSSDVRFGWS
jgi:hypothetical protein